MGVTKTELFSQNVNGLASMAKVISHPARIAILQQLLKSKSCINSDLVNELGLAQATISQHLRELKDSGLIQGSVEGTSICYCIHPEKWLEVQNSLQNFFNQFNPEMDIHCDPEQNDCC